MLRRKLESQEMHGRRLFGVGSLEALSGRSVERQALLAALLAAVDAWQGLQA